MKVGSMPYKFSLFKVSYFHTAGNWISLLTYKNAPHFYMLCIKPIYITSMTVTKDWAKNRQFPTPLKYDMPDSVGTFLLAIYDVNNSFEKKTESLFRQNLFNTS